LSQRNSPPLPPRRRHTLMTSDLVQDSTFYSRSVNQSMHITFRNCIILIFESSTNREEVCLVPYLFHASYDDRQCTRDFLGRCSSRLLPPTAKSSNRFVLEKLPFNMVFRSALLTASKRMAMVATSQVRKLTIMPVLSL
jgi:hypothetical protein